MSSTAKHAAGRLTVLALLALLSACGGDDDAGGDDRTASSSSSASSTGMSSSSTSSSSSSGSVPGPTAGDYFEHPMPWTRRIDNADLHPDSAGIIDWMSRRDEAGELFPRTNGIMQIGFISFHILSAGAATPRLEYDESQSLRYGMTYGDPPCDNLAEVPVPPGGRIEGAEGYQCAETQDADCHLLVHDTDAQVLYEIYHASVIDRGGERVVGGVCPVAWDLEYNYSETLRGQNCTSADAAGLPIAPLLVTADEIAEGEINHALRFILPNDNIRYGLHVAPATHSGGPRASDENAPVYGMRFRLRDDFPVGSLGESGRVIATALQRYGMIIADGGNIAFTFMADAFSENKWDEFDDFGPHMFGEVFDITDFEIVDAPPPVDSTQDCENGLDRSAKIRALLVSG